MRYVLAFVLCLLAGVSQAGNSGVLSEQRVVKLPEDGSKWYISVIGINDARYQEVLGWFDSGKLNELKSKVHFFPVTKDNPIYARYASSIKALPTVRVQDASGAVIYESAGRSIPMSGDGLYAAIANAVSGSGEVLPWRRRHANPQPVEPDPAPTPLDPEPQPLDDGGAPNVEPVDLPLEVPVGIVIGALIAGLVIGQVEKARDYHRTTSKK